MFEDIFHRRKLNIEKLQKFGFELRTENWGNNTPIMKDSFLLSVSVARNGNVDTRLIEKDTGEPYVLYKTNAVGSFVGEMRAEIEKVLSSIADQCFDFSIFKTEQALEAIDYVRKTYSDELEFLWDKFPDNAVWRRKDMQIVRGGI